MTFLEILRLPAANFRRHTGPIFLALIMIGGAIVYPSDLENDYSVSREGEKSKLVMFTEEYGRHINTLLPIAAAILLRDVTGLKQIAVIVVAGTVASHGPKRLLNNDVVGGTRLGERPKSPNSRHNMPSGHATLASAGAFIMVRRYGIWWALLVIPVTLLTMYARVMLDEHTISAVTAGAGIGFVVSLLFTNKLQNPWRRFKALFNSISE